MNTALAPESARPSPEVHEINQEKGNIVHLPAQDTRWRQKIVQQAQKLPAVGRFFTLHEATPAATQPIPISRHLKTVGAQPLGEGADLVDVSLEDARHHIETIGAPVFGSEPTTYDRNVSGLKSAAKWKERLNRLIFRTHHSK